MIHRLLRARGLYQRLAAPAAAATAHGLRMVVNLVIIKFIAVLTGPSGLGTLGNLMSATTMVVLFAGGGILNGITKYVAEFRTDSQRLKTFLQAASGYGLASSAVFLLISVLAAFPLARLLFGRTDMVLLLPLLGLTHLLCFIAGAVVAIVNGKQQPELFAAITITGYLGVTPIAFCLIWFGGVAGAGLALLAVAACTIIPAVIVGQRQGLFALMRPRYNREDVASLLRYTGITAVSAAAFPISEILIRTQLTHSLDLTSTGIWQAMTRLSGAFLGFFTVYLATSHMPRLSAIKGNREAAAAVVRALMSIAPVFAGCAVVLFLARSLIVPLLFSSEFRPLENIMGWQLLGDFFRVCSYVIGFLVVAKASLKLHIFGELTQCALYLSLSLGALHLGYGLYEVAQAYAATYAIYFAICVVALRRYAAT